MHGASKSLSCQREIASSLFHFPLDVSYAFTLFLYYFEYLFIRWMRSVKNERRGIDYFKVHQCLPIFGSLSLLLSINFSNFLNKQNIKIFRNFFNRHCRGIAFDHRSFWLQGNKNDRFACTLPSSSLFLFSPPFSFYFVRGYRSAR